MRYNFDQGDFRRITTNYCSLGKGELEIYVQELIGIIDELKIKRLASIAPNSLGSIVVELAAFKSGIVLIPLPTFFTSKQIDHALKMSGADFVIVENFETSPVKGDLKLILRNFYYSYILYQIHDKGETLPGVSRITFTSGSTANPKGVLLSRETLEKRAGDLSERIGAGSEDKFLSFMPYSILLETMTGIYLPYLNKAEAIVIDGVASPVSDPFFVYDKLIKTKATVTVMMPHMVESLAHLILLNNLPLPENLRFIGAGGAAVNRSIIKLANRALLPVYQGYGLSEAGSVVCLNNLENNRLGSVGKPLESLKVRISDGEIEVFGSQGIGYTDASLNCSGDGWLKTGDLGHLDEEGYLYIEGRKSNLIITSNGRNISPEWVEGELESEPGVSRAFVIGNGRLNPLAFCILNEDADLTKIKKSVNSRLPSYAWLSEIIVIKKSDLDDSLAMTPNGRFKRQELERYLVDKFVVEIIS